MPYRYQFNFQKVLNIKDELHELYLNQVIQAFAISLIGVFIPIYLIKLGYGFDFALLFVGAMFLGIGMFSPFGAAISCRIGMKRSIMLRLPLWLVYYGILMYLQYERLPEALLFLVGIYGGMVDSIYWHSVNSEFVRNSNKLHRGEQTSHMIAFPSLANIIGPTIGAFLLSEIGFPPLFLIVMVLMGVSVLPLFTTGDKMRRYKFTPKMTTFRLGDRLHAGFFAQGLIYFAEGIIWPLWIFITFGNLIDVGIAMSAVAIGIFLVTIMVGGLSDHRSKHSIMRFGGLGYLFVWIARFFASTYMETILLSLLGGIFFSVIAVSIFARFSDYARKGNIVRGVVSREMWLTVGRVGSAIIIVSVLMKFQAGFVLGALASLIILLI